MLKFLGNGSCFNVKSGNTSAYYYNKEKGLLLLIDCGESVFEKIVKKFNKLEKVIIVITHFHSDHIRSLPSFIFYCKIVKNIKPIVVFPNETIINLLSQMNVSKEYYEYKNTCKFIDSVFRVEHKENMDCFGYIFKIKGKNIYYSGDSKMLPVSVITKFLDGEIDAIYQDMTRYEKTGHAHVKDIAKVIPKKLRKHVYAMHLDDKETKNLALSYGFKIAK